MFTEREEISRNVGRKKRIGNVDGGWWDISPEVKRGKPAAGKPCELLSANLLRSLGVHVEKLERKKKIIIFSCSVFLWRASSINSHEIPIHNNIQYKHRGCHVLHSILNIVGVLLM